MKERQAAMLSGAARYFTGRPCKYGHVAERWAISAKCVECSRTPEARAWRKAYDATPPRMADSLRRASSEIGRLRRRAHKAARPDLHAANESKRRAAKLQRTPAWADLDAIAYVFRVASASGLTVDHVIPLQGRNVSGLHVENNLQLLTRRDNASKGNRYEPRA